MTAPASLACPLANGCHISPGAGAHFGVTAALGGKIHTGLDLSAPIGTRVLAPAPGILRRRWFDIYGGQQAELQHDGFTTRYLHLERVTAPVGSAVALGAGFALSGASGTVTGPHLHFEVLDENGHYVDPEPLLFGGASSASIEPPPWTGISMYPRDAGKSCPAGYHAGTVNAGILAGAPFNLWFNRPTNPDGTIDACIRADLGVGANGAAVDAAGALLGAVGTLAPIAVNVGIVILVVMLAFSGLRQTLAAGTA